MFDLAMVSNQTRQLIFQKCV